MRGPGHLSSARENTRRRRAGSPRRLAPALLLIAASALSACTYSQSRVTNPGVLSPLMGPMIYKEEGSLVLLTVSVNATRWHEDSAFIPVEVWVANKGVDKGIRITRESFYLMDTFGKRYGMAGVEEVHRLQRGLSQDRRMNSAEFTAMKFSAYRHVPTRFFPVTGEAILQETAELPKYAFMADMLYFPRPEGALRGGIFELHLTAKELEDEIFVVFEVPR